MYVLSSLLLQSNVTMLYLATYMQPLEHKGKQCGIASVKLEASLALLNAANWMTGILLNET